VEFGNAVRATERNAEQKKPDLKSDCVMATGLRRASAKANYLTPRRWNEAAGWSAEGRQGGRIQPGA